MKPWKSRTKKSKKLWDKFVKEFESEPENHELYQDKYMGTLGIRWVVLSGGYTPVPQIRHRPPW